MNPIHDDELVLFHFRDGLDPQRLEEIGRALTDDPGLSHRYATLQATLAAADLDRAPAPPAGFHARLLERFDAEQVTALSIPPLRSPAPVARRAHRTRRWHGALGGALAASLLLGVGFFAGRQTAPPMEPQVVAAERVYADALGSHLGATRRVLASARFDADSSTLVEANAALARALLDNHRLYIAAARHNGDGRLVALLQEVEPVLIELANPAGETDIQQRKGLGEFVDREDLIFQVRAVEAGLAARQHIET